MKLFTTFVTLVSLSLTISAAESAEEVESGFTTIFDGRSLQGWKVGENPQSWMLKNGELVAKGRRSHLYYVGDPKPYVNFELRVDVLTEANSNSGIYFHTKYQDIGWPKYGFEAQVNNSQLADPKRTGSLYGVVNVLEKIVPDDQWFTETIIVNGSNVTIKLNEKIVVNYDEPADQKAGEDHTRKIDSGTFALQAHDPGSTVHFKNIRVKRLD